MIDAYFLVDFVLFIYVTASRLCSRYMYAFPLYILRPKEHSEKVGFYLSQFFCVLLYRNIFSI